MWAPRALASILQNGCEFILFSLTHRRKCINNDTHSFGQFLTPLLFSVHKHVIQGGRENPGGREHLFGNVYFSTMRAATDKWSSSVERVDQIVKDWPLKQRLGPLKSRNSFYENPLVSGYCQFPDNSFKWFLALKNHSLNFLNIPARTHRQTLEIKCFVCP